MAGGVVGWDTRIEANTDRRAVGARRVIPVDLESEKLWTGGRIGGREERKILRMERYKHGLEVWGVLKTEGFENVRIEYKLCVPP